MKAILIILAFSSFLISCSKEQTKEVSKTVYPTTLSFNINFNDSISHYEMNGDRSSNNDSGAVLKKTDLTQNGYGPDYFRLRAGDNFCGNCFYFYVKAGTLTTSIYRTTVDEQGNGLALGSLHIYPYLPKGVNDKFGYGLYQTGDNFTLQITQLHGGLADGIFNGEISE